MPCHEVVVCVPAGRESGGWGPGSQRVRPDERRSRPLRGKVISIWCDHLISNIGTVIFIGGQVH